MNQESVFRVGPVALVRMAALPASAAEATRVDLGLGAPGYSQRLAHYLRRLAEDPMLREAVEVSSPSLMATVRRAEQGEAVAEAKLERGVFALAGYLLRMSGRPTPFGLFAGVAPADFGDQAAVRLGQRHRKAVRADAGWTASLVSAWEQDPAVLAHVRLVRNNLCIMRGDRLVLPYVRGDGTAEETQNAAANQSDASREPAKTPMREVSVRATALVRAVLAHAAEPIGHPSLVDALCLDFPEAPRDRIEGALRDLIAREILLTQLRPAQWSDDPLQHVRARLPAGPDRDRIDAVAGLLADYAVQPVGAGADSWRSAVGAMRTLAPSERPPIQVDLALDAEIRLSHAVAAEVERAATALWRMAPPRNGPTHLRDYLRAFIERYGIGRCVPLVDVLDPHRGLGAPAGYLLPSSGRVLDAAADKPDGPTERDRLLAELAQSPPGDNEVLLDDALLDRLAQPAEAPPVAGSELCIQLFADDARALDEGNFQLVVAPGGGSFRPGAMSGRFARMLGIEDALRALNQAAYRPEESPQRDPVIAQLFFQARRDRAVNVAQTPAVEEHAIAVGVFGGPPGAAVLDLADLAVVAHRERLAVVSMRLGREVVAVMPHVLALDRSAPNAARFLSEVTNSGFRHWAVWSWGALDVLPRTPRVRHGRTVLAAARWRPGPVLAAAATGGGDWDRELAAWRERWQVPDRVQVLVGDHRLELDLEAPLHRQLLRHELRRSPDLLVTEPPGGPDPRTGWLSGHAAELVVPLVARAPAGTAPASIMPVAVTGRARAAHPRHQVGGEWLYAKIYASPELQDALLARQVAELVGALPDGVDRWFFIRYRDPEPHLRLRIHGDPQVLSGRMLPLLHVWADRCAGAGLIGDLVLAAYEPEVHRYGGPEAIGAAEDLFHADSEAVLAQLRLAKPITAAVPALALAAANHAALLDGLGVPDWPRWVRAGYPMKHHDVFRRYRQLAVRLIDPADPGAARSAIPGAESLTDSWLRRQAAAARYGEVLRALGGVALVRECAGSVLHMHANRLLGVDREGEEQSYSLLHGVARAHLGRAAAAAGARR